MRRDSDDRLLSVSEAAQILGLAPATVRNWIHRGRLWAVRRDPKLYYLDAEEVELVAQMREDGIWKDSRGRPRKTDRLEEAT